MEKEILNLLKQECEQIIIVAKYQLSSIRTSNSSSSIIDLIRADIERIYGPNKKSRRYYDVRL